jgi:archaellum component FlaC
VLESSIELFTHSNPVVQKLFLESKRLSELNTLLETTVPAHDGSPRLTSAPTSSYQSLDEEAFENLANDAGKHDEAYVENLKKQLHTVMNRLKEVENNFSKIKSVSRNALSEFNLAKEEFANEVSARLSAEESSRKAIAQLKALQEADANGKSDYVRISREEISNLGLTRNELDITCKQLRSIRDSLSRDISELADKYHAGLSR